MIEKVNKVRLIDGAIVIRYNLAHRHRLIRATCRAPQLHVGEIGDGRKGL